MPARRNLLLMRPDRWSTLVSSASPPTGSVLVLLLILSLKASSTEVIVLEYVCARTRGQLGGIGARLLVEQLASAHIRKVKGEQRGAVRRGEG